jgi:cytochrome c553
MVILAFKISKGFTMKLKLALASLSLIAVSFTACGEDGKPAEAPVKVETPAPAKVETPAPVKVETPAPVTVETPAKETKAVAVSDGSVIFAKCASCHGQNAEKSALGKSQVIAGWEASKISDALHGYKDGTYGGAMKAIMKGQAGPLSDADIKAVSEFISQK